MRLNDAKKDQYRKLAKEQGYRSRASFKLIQLNQKYNLIKPNDYVIDIGAAPGSWLQVASKIVEPDGKVIGVDLRPIKEIEDNVIIFQDNINREGIEIKIREVLKKKANVVLSDLAPNISGIWKIDHNNQIDLTISVVNALPKILKKEGCCLLKVFDGPMLKTLENNLKNKFRNVKLIKPKASRSASSELYMICTGFKS